MNTSCLGIPFRLTCRPTSSLTRVVDFVVGNTTFDEALSPVFSRTAESPRPLLWHSRLLSARTLVGAMCTPAQVLPTATTCDEDPAIFCDIVLDSVEDGLYISVYKFHTWCVCAFQGATKRARTNYRWTNTQLSL